MKKSFLLFIMAFLAIAESSMAKPPKIYPKIAAYFERMDKEAYRGDNLSTLETLKHNFKYEERDSIVLVCSGNSFRSQALQVFLETKLAEKGKRKVAVFSCGYKAIDIDERLIEVLREIGYKIDTRQSNGKQVYQVRYSDKYPPILLYPKSCNSRELPVKPFISILACAEQPGSCEAQTNASIKINLSYKDRDELTGQAFKDEVQQIATDINYIFKTN